ncbi:DinB family protein [uncultured Pseudodesulfovibrio sp.]|uniref:DinB family protein n=1 Tax=uncultured Pseudodesulfovibrio sp. TaxID=2035858 RepID=UPI0029C8A716|nr:DinB family protein [uncultured Pseudodesulfovibrio sp.]
MTDKPEKTTTAILGALQGSITIFSDLLRSIPTDVLDTKRGEGFWSLHEHAAHLADVQFMGLERMRRILTEDVPEFVPFVPGKEDETERPPLAPVDDIVTQFKSGREKQLELLKSASPEDWKRTAIHPEYEQYGLYIFARHILMHDHWHMYRMEELWLARDEDLSKLEG